MPRFLALGALLVVGSVPGSAIALSLGDIDLKSALNQPFSAEIPIATESADDLAALTIGLAPAATFEQYGLDRAGFLNGFDFQIVPARAGGLVRISSRDPVVEPFVTLLLEVSWPQGRLLREYTVLLDPPVFAQETAAPVVEAPTAGPAPGPTRVVPPPATQPAPRTTPAPASAAPAPMPRGDSYGPVQRNDTLWRIAGRYAEAAGVDRNQMMLAIYRANPEAFVGNINRMKAGMILRVPGAEELRGLSRGEAAVEVRNQNQRWQATVEEAGTLRLVPPPDVEADAEPVGAGSPAGVATPAADVASLERRVRQLEDEIAEKDRLIELRDEQLAELQRELAPGDRDALPSDGEEPVAGEPVARVPPVEEPVIEEPVIEEPVIEEPPAAVARPNVVTTTPPAEPSFLSSLFTNVWLYVALGGALIVALFVVRRRAAEPEQPPWRRFEPEAEMPGEETMETTQQLAATPAADTSFVVEESVADQTDRDQVTHAADDDESTPAEFTTDQDVAETPLERTISAESPVNLDEADPIAEAEFHMAYGLYDQAADLLSNSLSAEPDRKDLRLKLLEVYFIWENQGGFLREATELRSRVPNESDPDWNKVLIMGKQICPDEELFAATPSAAGTPGDMDFALTAESGDGGGGIDFDFSETGSDVDAVFAESTRAVDFDLSADDLEGIQDTAGEGLDLDISEMEEATLMADDEELGDDAGATMESPIEPPSAATTMETPTIESPIVPPTGESTMETPTVESAALEPTLETPTIESEGLGTTLESPTVESESLEPTAETPTIESPVGETWADSEQALQAEQTAEIELDDLGLDLSDLEDTGVGGEEVSPDELEGAPDIAADTMQIEGDALEFLEDDTQRRKMPSGEPAVDEELLGLVDVEATGEMRGLDDTAEQPELVGAGETAEQPGLADAALETGEAGVDFDIGDAYADSEQTARVVPGTATFVEGATMTEVGTKLDLARAYIDMGDPDGARSILNEVLEEASQEQRQEAQKLLDDLAG